MKKVLKSLAALGLIMIPNAVSANQTVNIDYILRYYDNHSLEGEPVGGYIQYCDLSGYGWGMPTAYSSYEPVGPCD